MTWWPYSRKFQQIERQLDEVLLRLKALNNRARRHTKQGEKLMADLSRIQAEVAENGTVIGSAITLIQQIAEALRNTGTDQAAIDQLAADLDAQASALAAAITANTPAA
jgi:chromosome segregation ATPase